jgi:tripartite-type tricarboxylate transporter receptor subunit TctC
MMISRETLRGTLLAGTALVVSALAVPAGAQTLSCNPLTVVVNFPAGGGQDRAGRLVADFAQKRAGTPVVVTNATGAGGATGVRAVADAKPDGCTIGVMGAGTVAQQYLNENATPLEKIDPFVFFGPDPGALEVRADTGFTSVQLFVDRLKEKPGSVRNGNDPPGGISHIVASLLEKKLGVRLTKVPYQGFAPTVAAMLSGEVQSATLPVHQFIDQHKAGTVRILAVAADERHFMAPDVPTFKELGIDFVAGDWRALYMPVGVPAEQRTKLENLMMDTLSDPAFKEAAQKVGFMITPKRSSETMALIKQSDAEMYDALQEAGLVKVPRKP